MDDGPGQGHVVPPVGGTTCLAQRTRRSGGRMPAANHGPWLLMAASLPLSSWVTVIVP